MFRSGNSAMPRLFWLCVVVSAAAPVSWTTAYAPVEKPPEPAHKAVDLDAFEAIGKPLVLRVPAVAPDDVDTNFSGVAYNPATRTLLVVDNEPNAGDKADRPDQGDLYEFDAGGTYRRRIDLVGFSDPEGIALVGPDPTRREHDLYVVCEERIGTLAVVSIKRGKEDGQVMRGENGAVVEPKPNPVHDDNSEPNDGLEGVAYDAKADLFYVVKEFGPKRGVWRVKKDGRCDRVSIAGLFEAARRAHGPQGDLADIQFIAGHLLILSEIANQIVAVRINDLKGEIVGQFPAGGQRLPHRQPEGLALSDDGQSLWVVGEPRELVRYRAMNRRLPPKPEP
jgi:uncharacterized protein YjiK